MYYSSKNCAVSINNSFFKIVEGTLSTSASINSNLIYNTSAPKYYVAAQGLLGSLRIKYYLTGKDILKDYINKKYISANFGGLYFNYGVLSSYSVKGDPNAPITVDAEISFFDNINGSFNPTYTQITNRAEILNYSNTEISGNQINNVQDINSFSYDSSMEYFLEYLDDDSDINEPHRLSFGPQKTNLTINSSDVNNQIMASGKDAAISLLLKSTGGIVYENFFITGKIISNSLSFKDSEKIGSQITIRQDSVSPAPYISGFSPTTGPNLTYVNITGLNLSNVSQVLYGDKPVSYYKSFRDNYLLVRVDNSFQSGRFTINSQGGSVTSSSYFILQDGSIGDF